MYLINSNKEISMIPKGFNITESIPKGNWLLSQDSKGEFYLSPLPEFDTPKVLYGNLRKDLEEFKKEWRESSKNLGILLTGLKGSGKTLCTRLLTKELDIPTIFITTQYNGTEFNRFLTSITDEVAIVFDEFDKSYKRLHAIDRRNPKDVDPQDSLLTLIDGVDNSKKLYIFTSNSTDVSDGFYNRPTRIRFIRDFRGLELTELEEIVKDKDIVEEFRKILPYLPNLNYDLVIKTVNFLEKNPGSSVIDALHNMNVRPENGSYRVYEITKKGTSFNGTTNRKYLGSISEHPLSTEEIYVVGSNEGQSYPSSTSIVLVDYEVTVKDETLVFTNPDRVYEMVPMRSRYSGIKNVFRNVNL